jgi:hypothetical protein
LYVDDPQPAAGDSPESRVSGPSYPLVGRVTSEELQAIQYEKVRSDGRTRAIEPWFKELG